MRVCLVSGLGSVEPEDFEDCESDTEDTIDMTRAELSLARDQFEDAIQGHFSILLYVITNDRSQS